MWQLPKKKPPKILARPWTDNLRCPVAMSSNKDLSSLLSEAQKLTADIQHGEELPSVRRNLQQIAEAGQRLLSKTSGVVDENTDVKA